MIPELKLMGIRGEVTGIKMPLKPRRKPLTIGRGSGHDFDISDPGVVPGHARIEFYNKQPWLVAGKGNATVRLNVIPISPKPEAKQLISAGGEVPKIELEPGMIIELGRQSFEIQHKMTDLSAMHNGALDEFKRRIKASGLSYNPPDAQEFRVRNLKPSDLVGIQKVQLHFSKGYDPFVLRFRCPESYNPSEYVRILRKHLARSISFVDGEKNMSANLLFIPEKDISYRLLTATTSILDRPMSDQQLKDIMKGPDGKSVPGFMVVHFKTFPNIFNRLNSLKKFASKIRKMKLFEPVRAMRKGASKR
jgi:hypothetical protein